MLKAYRFTILSLMQWLKTWEWNIFSVSSPFFPLFFLEEVCFVCTKNIKRKSSWGMASTKRALSVVTDENSMVTKRLCLQKISNHTILTLGETTGIFWYRGFQTVSFGTPFHHHHHPRGTNIAEKKGQKFYGGFHLESSTD